LAIGLPYLHPIYPFRTSKYTNTCGPAALGTLIDYYNINISGLERKVFDPKDGKYHFDTIEIIDRICDDKQAHDLPGSITTPNKMEAGLKFYGFSKVSIGHSGFGNIGWGDLYGHVKKWLQHNCPVICLIDCGKLKDGPWFNLHYVVVYGIDNQNNVLFTGWSRQSKMDEATFLSAWSCNNINLGTGLFSHTAIFARP
jgi:hypothetical protein